MHTVIIVALLHFVIGCDCQLIIKENYDDDDDDDDDDVYLYDTTKSSV